MRVATVGVRLRNLQTKLTHDRIVLESAIPLFFKLFLFIPVIGFAAVSTVLRIPIFMTVAIFIVAACVFLVLFSKNQLTLDLNARTYQCDYGVYPFINQRQGSLDDIEQLSFGRILLPGAQGNHYITWCLQLYGRRPGIELI